jgi:hypothetical protein
MMLGSLMGMEDYSLEFVVGFSLFVCVLEGLNIFSWLSESAGNENG